jgi:hypothetical protein
MHVHAIFQLEMNEQQRYKIKCYIKNSIMQYEEFGKIGLEISGHGALSPTKCKYLLPFSYGKYRFIRYPSIKQ